jgi:hypothetical protein|tara:strand:- start:7196 stop:7402 length:207 start_codon:yes stop_codon:yes gene_type:complete
MARKSKLSGSTRAVLRKNNPPQGAKPRHWKQVWPYLKSGSIHPIWQDKPVAQATPSIKSADFSNPIEL